MTEYTDADFKRDRAVLLQKALDDNEMPHVVRWELDRVTKRLAEAEVILKDMLDQFGKDPDRPIASALSQTHAIISAKDFLNPPDDNPLANVRVVEDPNMEPGEVCMVCLDALKDVIRNLAVERLGEIIKEDGPS